MRRTVHCLLFTLSLLICSCSTNTPQTPLEVVSVFSSSSAQPWLSDLYTCAESVAIIRLSDSTSAPDIRLQLGEPEYMSGFAYQIDEEEIWVVTHRESPIPSMGRKEVQLLFAGLGDPSIQVWVYASGTDVQVIFDKYVMEGRSVTSFARLAANLQQMVDVLDSERQAIGILPTTWSMKMSGSHEVYQVATVPVLALTQNEPQGAVNQLIGCLQK
jgi:hypothetical protein